MILACSAVGIGALSFALALVSKGQDWMFWTVQQTLIFPILLLAGMLLPLEGAPGWLQVASDLNPLTYLVDAERALFAGSYPVDTIAGRLRGRRSRRRPGCPRRGPGDASLQLTADPSRVGATTSPSRRELSATHDGSAGCGW